MIMMEGKRKDERDERRERKMVREGKGKGSEDEKGENSGEGKKGRTVKRGKGEAKGEKSDARDERWNGGRRGGREGEEKRGRGGCLWRWGVFIATEVGFLVMALLVRRVFSSCLVETLFVFCFIVGVSCLLVVRGM